MRVSGRWGDAIPAGALRRLEILFGCLVLASLLTAGPRTVVLGWLTVVWDGAGSALRLLPLDARATLLELLANLARMGLAILPCALLLRSVPRYRCLWLAPPLALVLMVTSLISLPACPTWRHWMLLAGLSLLATWLVRRRFFRWAFLLPLVFLWHVAIRHGDHAADPAHRDRLLLECSQHPGERPPGLMSDRLMPYHGISLFAHDLILLTGEGENDGFMRGQAGGRDVGSTWMRRRDSRFEFERSSAATGNLWRGCRLGETMWMARNAQILGVRRLPAGSASHEEVFDIRLPSQDMDFTETACDPARDRIYVGEASRGGLWEVAPDGSRPVRHRLGGMMLLPKRRVDGRLVVSTSASLIVFDPTRAEVIEQVPAGLTDFGFDLCPSDGTAAVADMSGRLRIFTLDSDGRYRFDWGLAVFAPRRVAYSPDCARIAVTSADDRRVFIIDSAARRVVDVLEAGPALREVQATGPREFSFADMCSLTTYRW